VNYLSGLALNLDPPDLCLLSSWDYRRGPQPPDSDYSLDTGWVILSLCPGAVDE
jgi:hypothetical protein